MSLTASIEALFRSVYELFASIFTTIYRVFEGAITIVLSFITGLFSMVTDVFKGVIDALGGITHFVLGKHRIATDMPSNWRLCFEPQACFGADGRLLTLKIGNIVIIGVIAAAGFVYLRTQNGRPVVPAKKTN